MAETYVAGKGADHDFYNQGEYDQKYFVLG